VIESVVGSICSVFLVNAAGDEPLNMDATGVGHRLTAVCKFKPPALFGDCQAPVPQFA
jgi:hypothetical protein